jgi:lipopolysaccharide export system protein LptC
MRRYGPLLALLLILVAALSWWRVQVPPDFREGDARPQRDTGPREVDYTITGFDVTRMTEAGRPAHRLRATRLWHFTDDDTTELADPKLTVFQDQSPPWEVVAERAWVSADGSLVLLSGEVQIDRAGHEDNPPVRILTRNLRVQPREDYAETDEKVRVETDTDWLDAVGMQAWLRPPSRLKFLSQVKGYYEPR